jgi:N-methylhydantoinase A
VLWRTLDELPTKRLNEEFGSLFRRAEQDFKAEGWRGFVRRHFSVDVRYRGQGYELNVPYTSRLLAAFRREHERRYGYSYPAREIELVTLRLRAVLKSPQSGIYKSRADRAKRRGSDPQRASIFFEGKKISAAIYDRDALKPGRKYSGAAVVSEYSATTVVPPGVQFWLDRAGNLVIQIGS